MIVIPEILPFLEIISQGHAQDLFEYISCIFGLLPSLFSFTNFCQAFSPNKGKVIAPLQLSECLGSFKNIYSSI